MKSIQIGHKMINGESPALIMVDAGVNHNNSLDRGMELIESAVKNGADVVKFQTYKAKNITTKSAPRYWNDALNDDSCGTQYDTFSKIDGMTLEGYKSLKKCCKKQGVIFSSTPFNLTDIDLLEEIGMDLYKISSSDITYLQLLKKAALTGKPIILSTGCSSIGEIEKAINVIEETGNKNIILQHCILQYPCDDENANLNKMVKIQNIFSDYPVGYSDHSIGSIIPAAAVAMGAKTIEKHFTIDKKLPNSPDHKLSAGPEDLRGMVDYIRRIEKAKGYFRNGYYPAEEKAYHYARKSLVAICDIPKETEIKAEMLTCKRPGTGIYPEYLDYVVGKKAKVDILEDTTITKDLF